MIEWKQVSENVRYEISSFGELRNSKTKRLLKPYLMPDGYIKYGMSLGGGKRFLTRTAHTLVAKAFLGPRPSAQHGVAHNNGNRRDNSVANLRWATQKENLADRRLHGTNLAGATHPRHKLSQAAVDDIRERYARSEKSIRALARIHSVSPLAIADVIKRRSWLDS